MNQQVDAGGLSIAYDEKGAGERPFVLVHGFTGSRDDWADVIDELSAHGRTLAPDLRGHGGTAHAPGREHYTLDALVADLAAFADAVSAPRFDLLGHSMGGMAALRFTLAHPDRVASLVLMDTAPSPPRGDGATMIKVGAKIATTLGMPAMFKGMRAGGMQGRAPASVRCEEEMGSERYWSRIRAKIEAMDPQAFAGFGEALFEHEAVTERLADIACPTTVVVGVEDAPFVGPSRLMADRIPDAALVEISAAAHSPQLENRAHWLEAIQAHLSRARG